MERLKRFMRHNETISNEENDRIESQTGQGIYFHFFKCTSEKINTLSIFLETNQGISRLESINDTSINDRFFGTSQVYSSQGKKNFDLLEP
jgi:hypothetical protein